jgi:hypothetical protein
MSRVSEHVRQRAAALAEEIAAGVGQGRVAEWIEERFMSEMLDALRMERERCAVVADTRAEMWQKSLRRYASGAWPVGAKTEARERSKEAMAIADAIRVDAPHVTEA